MRKKGMVLEIYIPIKCVKPGYQLEPVVLSFKERSRIRQQERRRQHWLGRILFRE